MAAVNRAIARNSLRFHQSHNKQNKKEIIHASCGVACVSGKMNRNRREDEKFELPAGACRGGGLNPAAGEGLGRVRPAAGVVVLQASAATDASSQSRRREETGGGTSSIAKRHEKFALQKMSLDHAVSPVLPRPTAPFAKSERKRAYISATFYSTCFLQGINPADAETAALDAQDRYDKWWVRSKFNHGRCNSPSRSSSRKKRKHHHHHHHHYANETTTASNNTSFERAKPDRSGRDDAEQESTTATTAAAAPAYITCDDVTTVVSQQSSVIDAPTSSRERQRQRERSGLRRGAESSTSQMSIESCIREVAVVARYNAAEVNHRKDALMDDLKATGGDVTTARFLSSMAVLESYYTSRGLDARWRASDGSSPHGIMLDGTWLTLSKPSYTECHGRNDKGEYIYSLGRMSFDMFRPTGLRVSLQGVFNTICLAENGDDEANRPRTFPSRFQGVMQRKPGTPAVRNYDIATSFTVTANQTRRGEPVTESTPASEYVVKRPIRGLLTNHGYCVPDPDVPNRLSVWFSGGSLEVLQDEEYENDEDDGGGGCCYSYLEEWKRLFDERKVPHRDMREFARVIAAKILLGASVSDAMEEDGALRYTLKRPIGGHGKVFCDCLYADETLRVLRGHHGSLFVFARVPSFDDDGGEYYDEEEP